MTRVGLISDSCLTSYLKNNEPKQVSKTPTQTQDIQPMLVQCWHNVGPSLNQH